MGVTCLSAHSQNGENGEHVLAIFVTALGPTLGLVTVSLRMMAAMDARCQMRKSRVPVTCQPAPGLTGENGVFVWVSFVMAPVPTPGLVTAFLQMTEALDAPFQTRKSKALATCQPALGLIGESGVCAEAQTVGRQAL